MAGPGTGPTSNTGAPGDDGLIVPKKVMTGSALNIAALAAEQKVSRGSRVYCVSCVSD
jgi:hypothetical protein